MPAPTMAMPGPAHVPALQPLQDISSWSATEDQTSPIRTMPSSRATGATILRTPLSVSLATEVTLAAPHWPTPMENGSVGNPF